MNNKEALECVKFEILKYKEELKESFFDEVLNSGVIYGSSLSSAFLYSIFNDENKFKALPYAIAVLISSLISLKNHNKYSCNEEKQILKELKKIKRKIMIGNNPLENMTKDEFSKSLVKKIV